MKTRIAAGVAATASACLGLTGVAGASPVNVAVHTMGPNSPAYVSVGGYGGSYGSYGGGYYQHWNNDKNDYKHVSYHKDDDKKYDKHKSYVKPVHYVVRNEVKHQDKDWNKCPTGQVWGYNWSNKSDWKNYGKMMCMPVVVSASHSGCVSRVAAHYQPVHHYVKPAVSHYVAHNDYKDDHKDTKHYGVVNHEQSNNDHHYTYATWTPKHEVKEVKPAHHYNQPKVEQKDNHDYQNDDNKPVAHHYNNYGGNGGNTTTTRNTNNVDVDNNNHQVVTSGNVNASHNTHVGNITTGNASADNTTETNVELTNSSSASQSASHSWGQNRTTTTNTNNVSVNNSNTQNVRSGSVNVYGNTHVGNISTGDAMASNSTRTNVSIAN